MEEKNCTNELHPVSKGDETINKVEDYSSVSPECLKEQIEANKSEDPLSVPGEHRESEEKIKEDIVDKSKRCQEDNNIESGAKLREETSLNDTEVNEELSNTSNISSMKKNIETNEIKETQLKEISPDLAPKAPTDDNEEVEKQILNVETVDKDEAEVIKRDPDAVYISRDQIDEAEKSPTLNADEPRKIESPVDGDHVFEDKGIEQDAETKESLTAEELEANEVEETKGVPETSSNYLPQRVETIVEDDISSHKSLPEEKPEEQLQTSASTPSEDEEIRTVPPIEKIEGKIQKDAETKHKSLEDSSKTTEEVCLEKEVSKAVSEEEKNVDQGLPKEELEEPIQTTLPSEERKHGTGAISEEIEYDKTKEEVTTKVDVVTGDEITGEQTLSANKPDEGTTSSDLLSKEPKGENISTVEKTEEEKIKEAEIADQISEDSPDAKKTAEICLDRVELQELEGAMKDETVAAAQAEEPNEQSLTSSYAMPSENLEHGTTANVIGVEEEKVKEVEMPEKGRTQEIPNPVVTLPSDEHKHETVNEVDKAEEEKVKEEEIQNEDSDEANTVEEIRSEKDDTRGPQAVLESETIASQIIGEESQGHGTLREEKKIKEAETLEDETSPQSECPRELQGAIGDTAAQTLPGEKPADQLHVTTSILPSEVQENETKETKLQEDESSEKIPEHKREIEEASNVKMETLEKALDNELFIESEDAAIKEEHVKGGDETGGEENQCEKTNEGNQIILNEVSKEEVMEDKEVTETFYSTPHSEELTKGDSGENELKDQLIEDKTNEALETTCQIEELVEEAQKTSENEIIEKQIVFEDRTVEDPGQASVARIETATVTEEESSIVLSQAEGTKDIAEGNEKIDDSQQSEETTNIASDKQIPREFDPIEITEISSPIGKEHVPIELKDRVTESSQIAEVGDVKEIYPKVLEHAGEKTTENSGEEITKESMSVEDSTKASSSDQVESSTKETLQVTQDMTDEKKEKDETGAAQILLVKKPEEPSPASLSKLPSDEEHGVKTKVDAVEEKELKEMETLDKVSSDTKTGEEICLEKEENKELKGVVEQETIAVQAPPTEIKEDSVSHFEDGIKENELKDDHTGDKTNETLKIPRYEIQNEVLSVETVKHGANENIEKEIVAEDKTVKDLEQASVGMKEATIVREEIPGEADPTESSRSTSSIGKEQFPTEQQDRALETSEKPQVGDLEPGKAREICSEAVDLGEKKMTDNSGVEITQEPAPVDSVKLSLSDLLQRSTREKMQVAEGVVEERELTVSKEEAETIQVKEAKTDGEEGDERNNKTDSGSDAPVLVEAPRDTDTKPHKKSHNMLSGVGSKVKHSISKVKKAITGKSSHSKESKPISPKGSEK
ncbi:microtubule-associated protein futsch-like [Durio zibethinus]|uniref:Microtubule-associated protein futsch-like n=1 Tax=Durio zibethinus TaxID=66656 RepID=A0A6P6BBA8_DURZI|nr:microtubule-associated protein futsch-like [Durio zibethinus]